MAKSWTVRGGAAEPVYDVNSWKITEVVEQVIEAAEAIVNVPAEAEWQLLSVYVNYTASGSAGNRQIVLEIADPSGNVVYEARAGAVQGAGESRFYLFSPGVEPMTAFVDTNFLTIPLGMVFLDQLWRVRVYDNNAVAPDDFTMRLVVGQRSP